MSDEEEFGSLIGKQRKEPRFILELHGKLGVGGKSKAERAAAVREWMKHNEPHPLLLGQIKACGYLDPEFD